MQKDLIFILIFSFGFLLIFIANEFIYKRFNIESEYTRKSVHVLSGLLTLFLPLAFQNHFPVLILSIEFLLLLIISIKFNFFKCINNVSRKTFGSFLFPVSIYITFFFSIKYSDKALFYIPILILSLSDPLAAIAGKLSKKNKNKKEDKISDNKTFTGSFSFFISSFFISFFIIYIFYKINLTEIIILSLIISLSSTFIEKISKKGLDNISVPVIVLIILIVSKSVI